MELNFKIKDGLDKHLKLREEKLNYFKKKGFPNKRLEDWKFTDLEKILKENFKELNLPYIVLFTNPTTGGVSASFTMIGDI